MVGKSTHKAQIDARNNGGGPRKSDYLHTKAAHRRAEKRAKMYG